MAEVVGDGCAVARWGGRLCWGDWVLRVDCFDAVNRLAFFFFCSWVCEWRVRVCEGSEGMGGGGSCYAMGFC